MIKARKRPKISSNQNNHTFRAILFWNDAGNLKNCEEFQNEDGLVVVLRLLAVRSAVTTPAVCRLLGILGEVGGKLWKCMCVDIEWMHHDECC